MKNTPKSQKPDKRSNTSGTSYSGSIKSSSGSPKEFGVNKFDTKSQVNSNKSNMNSSNQTSQKSNTRR